MANYSRKKEYKMMTQLEKANLLKSLHIKGDPLILFNIWDAGSAKAMQEIGAKVIATGSWSVAASHGYDDGEKLSFNLAIENLKRIIASVSIPVTIDLEGGYGKNPDELHETVKKIIEVGAVGINFEDQIIGGEGLYSIEEQCARIKAIRESAELLSTPLFINARTDIFLKADSIKHNEEHLAEAIQRASAYAESGASGFFVPGLGDVKHIERLCRLSPLPINVMLTSKNPIPKQLAKLGVSRVSYGPHPYFLAIDALKEAGRIANGNIATQ
jgi:2-methylisocitrate lyase-like PEP mutase family enzyme